MNKIYNVNLGGYPFTIDDDAYTELKKYLATIKNHFSNSEGCEDILYDIEVRMAELFQENLGSQPIISNRLLDEIIAILGTPQDFGAVPIDDAHFDRESSTDSNDKKSTAKTKRMYRDIDGKIIAGVCGGLTSYIGIKDPLWVRIIFVFLFFTAGIAIPVYLILWVVLPPAISSSDKLAMKGEEINIENIAKTVESEFKDIVDRGTKSFEETFEQQKNNFKDVRINFSNILNKIFKTLGTIILGFINGIQIIFKPILYLIFGFLLLAFCLSVVLAVFGFIFSLPLISYFSASSAGFTSIPAIATLVALFVPILYIIILLLERGSNYKLRNAWKTTLGLAWIISVLMLIGSIFFHSLSYAKSNYYQDYKKYPVTTNSINIVKAADISYEHDLLVQFDHDFFFTEDALHNDSYILNIYESNDREIRIEKRVKSRGKTKSTALAHAKDVIFDIEVKTDKIIIPALVKIPQGSKYRGQRIYVDIFVPKYMKVEVDKSLYWKVQKNDFRKKSK